MKNLDLTKELIVATRNATLDYYDYMYTDHDSFNGQKLFLREIHFLSFIGESGELTMSEVAEKMNITQGAATQIATRLIKKNLIRKEKHPSDKRFFVISLTTEGEQAYSEIREYDKKRNEELAVCLDSYFTEEDIKLILKYENLIQDVCSGRVACFSDL